MRKLALIVVTAAVFSSPFSVKWSADKNLSVSRDNPFAQDCVVGPEGLELPTKRLWPRDG